MNLQSFTIITCSILFFHCFGSYGLSVKKIRNVIDDSTDLTTTIRSGDILDDNGNQEVHQVLADESQSVASTTNLPEIQSDGIEFVAEEVKTDNSDPQTEFKYPVTPDPEIDKDFTTVNPIPEDFDISDLNITENVVHGRASCTCGKQTGRIVGGDNARINELPWTAALVRGGINAGGRPYCGGTLINSRYVLTASHCVDGMQADRISVRLNQENIYSSPHVQSYGVSQIIKHPNYNRNTIDNDVALVQLSQPVRLDYNSPVTPACLPASNNFDVSGNAIAAGWGATAQGGSISNTLRKVSVPLISNEECNRDSKYKGRITENMMCAGEMRSGGKDSCQGDSGGPLVILNGGRATLIGVVSWGFGCAQPLSPGVYARVSRYPEWILANTRGADWCQG